MAISKEKVKSVFESANEKVRDFGSNILPVGQYETVLKECKLITKKGTDTQFVIQEFEVTEGECLGQSHAVVTDSGHEVALSILFGMWRKLGYDTVPITSMAILGEYCEAIKARNQRVMIRISKNAKNPQYNDLYIVSLLEDAEAEVATEAEVVAEVATEAEVVADEPVALTEGMGVVYSLAGKMRKGTIKEIKDEETVVVVDALTKKATAIPVDSIVEVQ